MRTPAEMPRRLPFASRRLRVGVLVAVVVVIIGLISLRSIARFWTDYLWFEEVHFTSVFRGVLLTKVLLAAVFIVLFFALLLASLTVADRVAPTILGPGPDDELVVRYREVVTPHGRAVRIVTAAIFALFAGAGAGAQWNDWDLFRYGVSFHATDPQWHHDIGFYVFKLPFITFLINWVFVGFIVILLVTAVAHYLNGGIRFQGPGPRATAAVKTHVSVLLAVLALVKAVDYYFERLELVLSTSHVVDGATATSVHANAPADQLLMVISALGAVLFIVNVRQKGWVLPGVAVALYLLLLIVVGGIYPALYQSLRVSPSELSRESVYIQRNIDATQSAYDLEPSQIKVVTGYQGTSTIQSLTPADQQTLANVSLLDPAQVGATFDKYQAIRSYYQFNSIDVDRYQLGGQLTQVDVSARELNEANVPSGFPNQRLAYTHGYGVAVAPAGEDGVDAANGTPAFTLAGVPPAAGGQPALSAGNGAEIYYGTAASPNSYVIADSKTPELDYENPSTLAQVSTHYAGSGGVPAGSLLRRAAFALRFGEADFVLSGQVTSSSRVMYYRNISQRVQKAAPFLKLDADPYAVVLDNQVYWVQDAYTTSDMYPYSQTANTDRVPGSSGLSGTFNYVRNSVKVVVNAYSGQMDLFVTDPDDPIIRTYERAFPDLFTPVSAADQLIPGITDHWRYPEDLYRVQTNMYGRYHLNDAKDFYDQANAWVISQDPGSGPLSGTTIGATIAPTAGAGGVAVAPTVARLDPEYIVAHQPDQGGGVEFMALQPFVAQSSTETQNLTAFMTATMSPTGAPSLTLYETIPGDIVDGPALIGNAIRSNNAVSQELTLFNEGGSEVLLGAVDTIPIESTLLYVQPIYVESTGNPVPTLHDVVVVYNGTAYRSGNASLDAALCSIGGAFTQYCGTAEATTPTASTGPSGSKSGSGSTTTTTVPSTTTTVPPSPSGSSVSGLLAQAQQAFAAASAASKAGNVASAASDEAKAEQFVAQAQSLLTGTAPATTSASTTTSVPAATSVPTTTAPKGG